MDGFLLQKSNSIFRLLSPFTLQECSLSLQTKYCTSKSFSFANILYRALSGDTYSIIHESFESNPHFGQKTNCISGETIFLWREWIGLHSGDHSAQHSFKTDHCCCNFYKYFGGMKTKKQNCVYHHLKVILDFFQVDAAVFRDFCHFSPNVPHLVGSLPKVKHQWNEKEVQTCIPL